ncbi:hypothetical protein LC605_00055 [Nostoc sp. CHAB 5836]|uniref:DUF6798 domain-containing protein n=1 Tax=Nostoc sp. CHAB 5836 TaxID=2780404 RepID=UPI001E5804A4|nr:DUF6798 domain-containing protein [Nostoc sp. CHAB 5836]MCC5613490.1 hypothetical protein [Nostoc sp. CHAB 5836]
MSQQKFPNQSTLATTAWVALEIIVVLLLLCLKELLFDIMASNDIDALPLARQFADPSWVPGDWSVNQPPLYRVLFQTLFGWMIASWGFLASSIIGRLLCYSLIAWGLVLIGRKLGLNLLLLMLAVAMFLSGNQGVAAGERIVGTLETKIFAYAMVLLAIAFMLNKRYRLTAFLLGLGTSFHILVGGYATLFVLGWVILRRKNRFPSLREIGFIIPLYLIGSVFGLKALIEELSSPNPTSPISISYIYVFFRMPHHLNPLSWPTHWWIIPLFFLLMLVSSAGVLWFNRPTKALSEQFEEYEARIGLFDFTLISLVPYALGVVIAPFDSQGSFLQYYLFRVGDVMLHLNACLLFVCALDQIFTRRKQQRVLLLLCSLVLSISIVKGLHDFQKQFQSTLNFPNEVQEVDPQWKDLTTWVRKNTPKNATFISPPVKFANFIWLTERPTIAKYKLMAQTKAGTLEWFSRMRDLSGNFNGVDPLTQFNQKLLTDGYNNLTTDQVKALMIKYDASYLVTRIQHRLDIPVVYRNKSYVLYRKQQD